MAVDNWANHGSTPTGDVKVEKSLLAQAQLASQSQQFQLGMAQLQSEDAKAKSAIALQEAMAASDRSNSDRVAQYIGK